MLYLIYAEDHCHSTEKRLSVRPAHLARLQQLHDENRLLTAGPLPLSDQGSDIVAFSGSVIIAEFPSLEEAKNWADKDPYVSAGVYKQITVKPFKRVF